MNKIRKYKETIDQCFGEGGEDEGADFDTESKAEESTVTCTAELEQ